jgi:hypothetical protein
MDGCWAHIIGGCGGGWSKEHLPSRGFYTDGPITMGGWGLPDRKVPMSSAGSHILCRNHNQRQPADEEGKRFSDATKQVWGLIRGGTIRKQPLEFHFDGPLLERYILKATIGTLILKGKGSRWFNGAAVAEPPRELVEAAYGIAPLKPPLGLYAIELGVPVTAWVGNFNLLLQFEQSGVIRAARIEYHSFYYLMWMSPDRPPSVEDDEYTLLADTSGREMGKKLAVPHDKVRLTYRQAGNVFDGPNMRAIYHIKWPEGAR